MEAGRRERSTFAAKLTPQAVKVKVYGAAGTQAK
jgi:hypothetical protein